MEKKDQISVNYVDKDTQDPDENENNLSMQELKKLWDMHMISKAAP